MIMVWIFLYVLFRIVYLSDFLSTTIRVCVCFFLGVSVLLHHTKFIVFGMLVFCSHETVEIQTAEV